MPRPLFTTPERHTNSHVVTGAPVSKRPVFTAPSNSVEPRERQFGTNITNKMVMKSDATNSTANEPNIKGSPVIAANRILRRPDLRFALERSPTSSPRCGHRGPPKFDLTRPMPSFEVYRDPDVDEIDEPMPKRRKLQREGIAALVNTRALELQAMGHPHTLAHRANFERISEISPICALAWSSQGSPVLVLNPRRLDLLSGVYDVASYADGVVIAQRPLH